MFKKLEEFFYILELVLGDLWKLTASSLGAVPSIVALPHIIIPSINVPFYFGGTCVLIVVGLGIDIIQRIESYFQTRF